MGVSVLYHGHSNLEIISGGHVIQVDPFYTSNPLAVVKAEKSKATFILLSHAHSDHVEDAEAISRRTGAPIVSNFEIAQYYAKRGVKNTHGMNHGGGHDFAFGRVTLTPAFHTSSFEDGTYGGQPAGLVIETGGKTIYFAGDTALFGDMKLIGELWKIDLACLPIGDNFTMGPAHAAIAAEYTRAKMMLPIHYNTFGLIKQDGEAFCRRLGEKGIRGVALKAGERVEV